MAVIIGLNAYHADSAACLIRDGRIEAAVEEERFTRQKHWSGIPVKSVRFCMEAAGVGWGDIDAIGLNTAPATARQRKYLYIATHPLALGLAWRRARVARKRRSAVKVLDEHFGLPFEGKIIHVEHHIAHLASAYFASGWENAAALSLDGFGDFASAAYGLGVDGKIKVFGRTYFPHSLGIFYQAITQYLGFPQYGDEYKVMGLAPYGRPRFLKEMEEIAGFEEGLEWYRLNLKYFRHHRHDVTAAWNGSIPRFEDLFTDELERLLGPRFQPGGHENQRAKDIASSLQKHYERLLARGLDRLHALTGSDRLVLAGGCGMNSVANGKICEESRFKKVFVQPAAGDAGGALGAAYWAYRVIAGDQRPEPMESVYLGPEYSDSEIGKAIRHRQADIRSAATAVKRFGSTDDLCRATAGHLATGAVVGWFQGRMEWGARALGNRSILADPRNPDIKTLLNRKIKHRESFRPFAPSVLRDEMAKWFEVDDDVPHMMKVYRVRPDKRTRIPGVVHVDGTGRLQTVRRQDNPLYYDLISAFRDMTGIPMLLNTSFNENEPIVCTPHEALDCFLRTKMDVLVMNRVMITRS